jgi:uncharacterized cupredoxin-like copper-binding protein
MKRSIVLIMTATFALAMAACSSSSSSSSTAAGTSSTTATESPDTGSGDTVASTEKDFAITLDSTSVASGEVTFNITNEGPSLHEFVVIQTDLAPDALPVKDNEVQEDKVDGIGEQEDIAPGTSTDLSLKLDPGSYVVICNITGHYEQGMHAGLTVT